MSLGSGSAAGTSHVISSPSFLTLERPQLSWLVPGYVPRPGLILLIGEAKVGKSYLALQLALAVAGGGTFLQAQSQRESVLFLQFDTSELVWRQRLQALQSSGVQLPQNLYVGHPELVPSRFNLLQENCQQYLRQCITECNPGMIILDVMRELHNADEQDSTEMKAVGDILMEISRGRVLVLVHHVHKLGEERVTNVPNAARGSSYLPGKADAVWLLREKGLQIASRVNTPESKSFIRLPNGLFRFF